MNKYCIIPLLLFIIGTGKAQNTFSTNNKDYYLTVSMLPVQDSVRIIVRLTNKSNESSLFLPETMGCRWAKDRQHLEIVVGSDLKAFRESYFDMAQVRPNKSRMISDMIQCSTSDISVILHVFLWSFQELPLENVSNQNIQNANTLWQEYYFQAEIEFYKN